MAKKISKKNNVTRDAIIAQAVDTLESGMGYSNVEREDIGEEPCVVVRIGRRPLIVAYVPDSGDAPGQIERSLPPREVDVGIDEPGENRAVG